MVEIMENELRIDSQILQTATDEEIEKLREVVKTISRRAENSSRERYKTYT